jgi:large subunit ribosomal protein L4
LQENSLVVLDQLELEEIKTKAFIEIIDALDIDNALIVTSEKDEKLERSSRNVPNIKVLRSEGLNVYDIQKYQSLVLLEPVINDIEGRLGA